MSSERARRWYRSRRKAIRRMYWSDKASSSLYFPSGFREYPKEIYDVFTGLIDRDGRVLDLGCGNGLLLKHIVENSEYELEPFGVDFIEESIEQARRLILPAYSSNFTVANIVDYSLEPASFDFILVDPTDIHKDDLDSFIDRVIKACRPSGKVIFYSYRDVLRILLLLSIASKVFPPLRERLAWRTDNLVTWVGKLLPARIRNKLERIEHKHVSIGVYNC